MHRIVFDLKKAHLGGVRFAKEHLGIVPHMTPARYDLLYAIRMNGYASMLDQAEIRRQLGLHPSTVSKAIKRLVELGWLAKNLWGGDRRRTNSIHLTAAGFEALELARRIVEKRRTVRWWFDARLRPYLRGWRSAHRAIWELSARLDAMADAFGQDAALLYALPYIVDE